MHLRPLKPQFRKMASLDWEKESKLGRESKGEEEQKNHQDELKTNCCTLNSFHTSFLENK